MRGSYRSSDSRVASERESRRRSERARARERRLRRSRASGERARAAVEQLNWRWGATVAEIYVGPGRDVPLRNFLLLNC